MAIKLEPMIREIFEPFEKGLSPELAKLFVAWRLSPETEQRMQDLGEKANEGQLTPEEDAELRAFIELCDRVSILKLRSEALLRRAGSAA